MDILRATRIAKMDAIAHPFILFCAHFERSPIKFQMAITCISQ
jgi:hypothetical protein